MHRFFGKNQRANFKFFVVVIGAVLLTVSLSISVVMFANNEKTVEKYELYDQNFLNKNCSEAINRITSTGFFFGTLSLPTIETEEEGYYQYQEFSAKYSLATINANYIQYIAIRKNGEPYVSTIPDLFLDQNNISNDVKTLGSIQNTKVYFSEEGAYNNQVYFLFDLNDISNLYNEISIGVNNYKFGQSLLTDELKERRSFIINREGTIIFSDDTSIIYKSIYDELGVSSINFNKELDLLKVNKKDAYFTIKQIDNLDLYTVTLTDKIYYENYYNTVILTTVLLVFVSLILSVILAFTISRRVYQPIYRIIDNMKFLSLPSVQGSDYDEVEFINEQFLNLNVLREQLESDIAVKNTELRRSNVQVLQSQISSHFMYNTLDNIKYELYSENNPLYNCISSIAKILQYVLDIDNPTATVKEEIEISREYINILAFRYLKDINFEVEIDDELLKCEMLKFSIQPILENAVQHGLRRRKNDWKIILRMHKTGRNTAEVEISDNGIGIDEESLGELNTKIRDTERASARHVGLRNINRRLKLMYGEDCVITVYSDKGKGTTCRFNVKLEEEN